jgi:hypothetical protein
MPCWSYLFLIFLWHQIQCALLHLIQAKIWTREDNNSEGLGVKHYQFSILTFKQMGFQEMVFIKEFSFRIDVSDLGISRYPEVCGNSSYQGGDLDSAGPRGYRAQCSTIPTISASLILLTMVYMHCKSST